MPGFGYTTAHKAEQHTLQLPYVTPWLYAVFALRSSRASAAPPSTWLIASSRAVGLPLQAMCPVGVTSTASCPVTPYWLIVSAEHSPEGSRVSNDRPHDNGWHWCSAKLTKGTLPAGAGHKLGQLSSFSLNSLQGLVKRHSPIQNVLGTCNGEMKRGVLPYRHERLEPHSEACSCRSASCLAAPCCPNRCSTRPRQRRMAS